MTTSIERRVERLEAAESGGYEAILAKPVDQWPLWALQRRIAEIEETLTSAGISVNTEDQQ